MGEKPQKRKRRIKELERYGKSGWEFKIKNTRFRTNGSGEGLWSKMKTGAMRKTKEGYKPHKEFKQVTGTAQYSLPKDRKKARSKIYYDFIRKETF